MHLGAESSETCNTYNMLKLTRHLFGWLPSADLMDFYERGLYNHILASQELGDRRRDLLLPAQAGRVQDVLDAERRLLVLRRDRYGESTARYTDAIYFARRPDAVRQPVHTLGADVARTGARAPAGDAIP